MNLIAFMLDNGMNEEQLRAFFTSNVGYWTGQQRLELAHSDSEIKRLRGGQRRRVDYFHQSDDPYSQLIAQVLPKLLAHYDVDFVPHLVSSHDSKVVAASKLHSFVKHRRQDAIAIAPFYGLTFPAIDHQPKLALKLLADRVLTQAIADGTFFEFAAIIGKALWANDRSTLERYDKASQADTASGVEVSETLRLRLGYFFGSSFFYGGEWFLGVDRIIYLEERLVSQGARHSNTIGVVVPRPRENRCGCVDNNDITLEVFVSVRSAYGAIVIPLLESLVKRTGINLVMRPLLPITMLAGGLSDMPIQQMIYLYADAGREARYHNMPYGDIFGCTGIPITNCYSLFPWARDQGRELDLIAAFLDCVFFRGVDTATDAGIQIVVERACLDWGRAAKIMGNTSWQVEIDKNRQDLNQMGLSGGLSFRLSGGGYPALVTRGQDRLFVLEADIQKRAGHGDSGVEERARALA